MNLSRWAGRIGVVLVSLLAQGLLLLNEGTFWDAWTYSTNLREHDWTTLYGPFRDAGYPAQAYMLWPLHLFANPDSAARWLDLLLITVSGLILLDIFPRLGLRNREALVVALGFVAFPTHSVAVTVVLFPILVSMGAFFLGVYVDLLAETFSGWRRWLARAAALTLLVVSYVWRSFLVFVAAYLLGLIRLEAKKQGWLKATFDLARRRPELWLLGPAYFLYQRVLVPQQGRYLANNAFQPSPRTWVRHLAQYFYRVLIAQNLASVQAALGLLAFVAVVGLVVFLVLRTSANDSSDSDLQHGLGLLAAGTVVLGLAALPYAVVGKPFELDSWNLRNGLLAPVPMGLLLAGAFVLLSRLRTGLVVAQLFVAFFVALWAARSVERLLEWQARWVRDQGTLLQLASLEPVRRCGVIWVQDQATPQTEQGHRYYEWAAMMHRVFGDERHLGLDRRMYDATFFVEKSDRFSHDFYLSAEVLESCRAELKIENAGPRGAHELALGYLQRRLFGADADGFARDSVRLSAVELPDIDAPALAIPPSPALTE